jgi:hypothetical protein
VVIHHPAYSKGLEFIKSVGLSELLVYCTTYEGALDCRCYTNNWITSYSVKLVLVHQVIQNRAIAIVTGRHLLLRSGHLTVVAVEVPFRVL